MLSSISPAAEPVYLERLKQHRHEADSVFRWLLPAQWIVAIIFALVVSPQAWAGTVSSVHPHLWAAVFGGALLVAGPWLCLRTRPDWPGTAQVVAVAQMLFSALFIHLTGGRLETHFHVFGSLAILAFYLRRSVLITAGAVVIGDHLLRGIFAPMSVYGVSSAVWWRSLEHGGWVMFEMVFLIYFTRRTVTRTLELAAESVVSQKALHDSERQLRLVIDSAYDAFVAMDAEGHIVDWNDQAEKTFGWTRSEVLGKSLSETIVPERFRDAHTRGLKHFVTTGEGPILGQRLELSAIRRNGQEFPIEITVSAVRWRESHIFNAFLRDITDRQELAHQHEEMTRQVVAASRQAGKAEVAVGVLHNVGNVLNSVNVAAGIINDTVRASKVNTLGEVVELIQAQNGNLADFLTNDPRGRLVPELLGRLTEALRAEHATLTSETTSLVSHVGHIRETVSLQQSHATIAGVTEKVAPLALLEDAMRLEGSAMVRHGIEVIREVDDVPMVYVDRHKTLQILVNLLRNAKQAMVKNEQRGKRLTVAICQPEGGPVKLAVRDNGIGIAPENLSRIFGHGFTTKENGHGFGLHISALAAREMGGKLSVSSDGLGLGAVFTLQLPVELPPGVSATAAAAAEPTDREGASQSPESGRCPLHASTLA